MKHYLKHSIIILVIVIFSSQNIFCQNLTKEDRIFGLSKLWSEITYNYPYIDQIDFELDSLYMSFIDKVVTSESDLEYYNLLNRFLCSFHEGHTYVRIPEELSNNYHFQVMCTYTHNKVYVTSNSTSNIELLPVGSEIISVNGMDVFDYLDSVLFPNSPVRYKIRYRYLSEYMLYYSETDSVFDLSMKTPAGDVKNIKLPAIKQAIEWGDRFFTYPRQDILKMLDDSILYVSFTDFKSKKYVDMFCDSVELLKKSKGLIIDLRHCIGGTSYGAFLYPYFTPESMYNEGYYEYRIIQPYLRAWGMGGVQSKLNQIGVSESDENYAYYVSYLETYQKWVDNKVLTKDSIPMYIQDKGYNYNRPIVILIDEKTASAAEIFLIGMKNLVDPIFIGTPSYGSAGMPLLLSLPGGGQGQFTTQKPLYPDGTEFSGLIPDVFIEPTIEQILTKNDTVLNYAIEKIKELNLKTK